MPRADYKNCRACGGHVSDVGVLSHSRLCAVCGPALNRQAGDEQHHHRGVFFNNWRRGVAASVGAVILDDSQAKP